MRTLRTLRTPRTPRTLAAALLLAMLSVPALAQTSDTASRERTQLRRAQAALQESQTKLDALQAEKAALIADKATLSADMQRQRTASRGQQVQREQALQGQVEQIRKEAAAATAGQQQKQAQATEREAQLQAQLTKSRQELAELRQSNTGLAALLTGKTEALTTAAEMNRELHALGMLAIERWLNKTQFEGSLQTEPLFGINGVRVEDSAEALRARIDAQRLPTAPLQ